MLTLVVDMAAIQLAPDSTYSMGDGELTVLDKSSTQADQDELQRSWSYLHGAGPIPG